jgi:hypothetical protein
LAGRLAGRIREEWGRNFSTALRAAEEVSKLSREDLAEQLSSQPGLQPMVTRLLYAAGMNGHDATLRAMGMALGKAVREPDRHGECELILLALSDLNAAHTEMLQLLEEKPPPYSESYRPWTSESVMAASTLPKSVAPLVLAAVIARGLARQSAGGYDETVSITELGQLVLDVLANYIDADHKRAPRH